MGEQWDHGQQAPQIELERLRADCAALRQQLVDTAALVGEVEHRAKNVLSMASALLRAGAAQSDHAEARRALQAASDRLNALAAVHANIYESGSATVPMAPYLAGLAAGLRPTDSRIDIIVDVDEIDFPPGLAPLVGLLVNEAVTNALKHAYGPQAIGRINVRLQVAEAGDFRLVIEDDGKGLPNEVGAGLGFKIVRMLARQIHGQAYFEPVSPCGLRVVIVFPQMRYWSGPGAA